MKCQECGTIDNKQNRGPVKLRNGRKEKGGLCEWCNRLYYFKKIILFWRWFK